MEINCHALFVSVKKTYDCTTFMNHEIISNKILQVIYFAVINSDPMSIVTHPPGTI